MEDRVEADGARRSAADGAGIVLRLPPLHARPKDDDQQQRDQTGEHARRHRRPDPEALRRGRTGVLLPQRRSIRARRSRTRCRCSTSSRTRRRAASACRCRPACVRVFQADSSGGVQFVGEDRIDHTPKDETLNVKIGNAFDVVCERKQTGFEKIAGEHLRVRIRNHAAQPQDGADQRRSERAGRRHVAACCSLVAPVDEDGRVGRAVYGACGGGRHVGAEVPRARDVLRRVCHEATKITKHAVFVFLVSSWLTGVSNQQCRRESRLGATGSSSVFHTKRSGVPNPPAFFLDHVQPRRQTDRVFSTGASR